MAARRPDFIAYSVTPAGAHSRFREVGVAFWNQKRTALTVLVDAAPLSGRVVLSAPRDERTDREPGSEG